MDAELTRTLNKAVLYLNNLDSGFVIIEVNEYHLQKAAVEYITGRLTREKSLIVNLKNFSHEDSTHLDVVKKNVMENPDVSVFLILNLHALAKQISTGELGLVQDLNFSREPYARLERVLVFFLPVYFVDLVIRHAKDFFDFVPVTFKLLSKDVHTWKQPDEKWGMADEKFLRNRIGFLKARLESDSLTDSEKAPKLSDLADCYGQLYEYNEALNTYRDALSIYQQIDDTGNQALILREMGILYRDQGDIETGLKHLRQSLKLNREINNPEEEAATLSEIGLIYYCRGEYDVSLDYYTQSLELNRSRREKASTLNRISLIYHKLGEYDTALNYLRQSLTLFREIGDHRGEAMAMGDIGQNYRLQGDYDSALNYNKQSYELRKEHGGLTGEAWALDNIGWIHSDRGDYDTALDYHTQSLELMKLTGFKYGEGFVLSSMGRVYYKQGKIREATEFMEKAVLITKKFSLSELPEREEFLTKLRAEAKTH